MAITDIQRRIGEDPRDHGAKADGSTDDTNAIKATTQISKAVLVAASFIADGLEVNDPASLVGLGWDKGFVAKNGGTLRPVTFRNVADDRTILLAFFEVDGNSAGALGDALLQINDSHFLALGLYVHDSDMASASNGMNGINAAINTKEDSNGQIVACRFERLSKGAINFTGGSIGGVAVANWILGGTSAFNRAPGLQVNNGKEFVAVANYIKKAEGHGVTVEANAATADDVVIVGQLIMEPGQGVNAGAGVHAGDNGLSARGLLVGATRIVGAGKNVKSNAVEAEGYTGLNVVGVSIDGATQSGVNLDSCHVGAIVGIDMREIGSSVGSGDSLITLEDCSDLVISGVSGRGGAFTNYALTIRGVCERLHIAGNNLSGWQTGPVNFGGGATFPKDSYIEIPFDFITTDATVTTVITIPMSDDQIISMEVDCLAVGATDARTALDTGSGIKRSGVVTVLGATNFRENESTSTMAGVVNASGNTGLRYRVTGIAGQTIRWKGVARVRSSTVPT